MWEQQAGGWRGKTEDTDVEYNRWIMTERFGKKTKTRNKKRAKQDNENVKGGGKIICVKTWKKDQTCST